MLKTKWNLWWSWVSVTVWKFAWGSIKGIWKKNHYQVKFKQGNDKKKNEWIILLDFLWSWASVTVLKFAWGSIKGKWKKSLLRKLEIPINGIIRKP